jgi:hypothetical protein
MEAGLGSLLIVSNTRQAHNLWLMHLIVAVQNMRLVMTSYPQRDATTRSEMQQQQYSHQHQQHWHLQPQQYAKPEAFVTSSSYDPRLLVLLSSSICKSNLSSFATKAAPISVARLLSERT